MTTEEVPERHLPVAARLASKVPEATAMFWIAKALTTAMGESASDFLVHSLPPALAVLLGAAALAGALALQFAAPRYVPWKYWLAVAMVGVFGTMAADVLHVGLGVPYLASTILFALTLVLVFFVWFRTERTLSIHSITTRRRELFYWCAVMTTFALGTATGDMSAVTLGWGYFSSALLFAAVIAIPAVAYWRFGLNGIVAFWWAYIATRPLGASFADWVGVSPSRGGLGLGPGPASLILIVLIVALVARFSVVDLRVDGAGSAHPDS